MLKISSLVIKVCNMNGNLKYEPKESCDNFSVSAWAKPSGDFLERDEFVI